MQEISLRQVIEYAIAIEEEGYRFYRRAMRVSSNGDIQQLAESFATDELNQANRFRAALGTKSIKAQELDRVLMVEDALMPELTRSDLVRKDEFDKDILKDAIEREEASQKLYSFLASVNDLNAAIKTICEEFIEQEGSHLSQLKSALDQIA